MMTSLRCVLSPCVWLLRVSSAGALALVCLAAVLASGCGGGAAAAAGSPRDVPLKAAPLDDDPLTSPRTEWFREGKFGMFIHWGVYAVPAGVYDGKEVGGIGEWIMDNAKIPVAEYEKFAARFNPVKFNAADWARLARDAGMTYLVITSKHHDGFSMWPSDVSKYDIADATPFGRDPMKELAQACRAEGIKFCFYHSIMDWHHPQAKGADFAAYHQKVLKPQVKELITRYGPLGILWFDGEWIGEWDDAKGTDLYRFCRTLQPSLIVNNRVGKRKGTDGDYETPEQTIPAGAIQGRLWETCMTLNDTWGFKTNDQNWKSATDLVRKLIDITSKGGNFLLNVGPTAEGLIPQPSVDRLRDVGRWLRRNGDAIYGTTASPWKKHPFNGRCTVKGRTLYVHVFEWDGPVRLPGVKGEVVGVAAVNPDIGEVKYEVQPLDGAAMLVLHPPESPDLVATVVAVRFKDAVAVDEALAAGPPIGQAADGTVTLQARDATVHGDTARYESGGGKDNIGFWTDAKDWVSWTVQVAKPGTFDVEMTYATAEGCGGSEFAVAAGDATVDGKTRTTGSWTEFVTEKVGTLAIAKAGKTTVSVKPKTKPGLGVMNLKAIVLKPAGK